MPCTWLVPVMVIRLYFGALHGVGCGEGQTTLVTPIKATSYLTRFTRCVTAVGACEIKYNAFPSMLPQLAVCVSKHQCDQMARLFVQYLAVYNIKFCLIP